MTFNPDKPALANAISEDIPDIEENFAVLGPYKTLWFPADLFTAYTGTAEGTHTLGTTNAKIVRFPFDGTTVEFITTVIVMPENWNKGTIKAKVYWMPDNGCTANDGVVWGVGGIALSDDGTLDTAVSGAQEVTDTVTAGVEADLHVTDPTAAITIAGTPAVGDFIIMQVYRDPTDGSDDMAEDAKFIGLSIQYVISEETGTAWS